MSTPTQRKILRELRREGVTSPKIKKAAIEANLTEASGGNPGGGDRDSVGAFQIRTGIHKGVNARSVRDSTKWFISNAKSAIRPGQSSGELAQAVERSAYPGRYAQHSGEAAKLLRSSGGGSGRGRTTTKTTPGIDRSPDRQALVGQYLQSQPKNPQATFQTLLALRQMKDTPGKTVTVKSHTRAHPSGHDGTISLNGKPVNASIASILKDAKASGDWKGQVTSGWRSNAEQAKIYASGVRPAAPPGQSMHRFKRAGKGAVDVTDAAGLNRYLKRHHLPLKYAGSKDPVHFSQGAPSGSY